MATLQIKVDGQDYELDTDTLTLGEKFHISRDYGGWQDIEGASIGFIAVALQRADPQLSWVDACKRVEALTGGQVEVSEPNPTPAVKPRKKPGDQS